MLGTDKVSVDRVSYLYDDKLHCQSSVWIDVNDAIDVSAVA